MEILMRGQRSGKAYEEAGCILEADELVSMRTETAQTFVHEKIYRYIAELSKATRENEWTELGMSPRGTVALTAMAKACAWMNGRKYVIPSDVQEVFPCVAGHRIFLNMKAKVGHIRVEELIRQILENVPTPELKTKR